MGLTKTRPAFPFLVAVISLCTLQSFVSAQYYAQPYQTGPPVPPQYVPVVNTPNPQYQPRKLGIVLEDNKPKPSVYQTPPKESERYPNHEADSYYEALMSSYYHQPNYYAIPPQQQTYPPGYTTASTTPSTTATTASTSTATTPSTSTTASTTTTTPSTTSTSTTTKAPMTYPPYYPPAYAGYRLPLPAKYEEPEEEGYEYARPTIPSAPYRRPYRRQKPKPVEYEEPNPFTAYKTTQAARYDMYDERPPRAQRPPSYRPRPPPVPKPHVDDEYEERPARVQQAYQDQDAEYEQQPAKGRQPYMGYAEEQSYVHRSQAPPPPPPPGYPIYAPVAMPFP